MRILNGEIIGQVFKEILIIAEGFENVEDAVRTHCGSEAVMIGLGRTGLRVDRDHFSVAQNLAKTIHQN